MAKRRPKVEEHEIRWRAIAAWVKYAGPGELNIALESVRVVIVEAQERSYVQLTAGKRVIATYRIRVDNSLKRMRRPPRELRGDDD